MKLKNINKKALALLSSLTIALSTMGCTVLSNKKNDEITESNYYISSDGEVWQSAEDYFNYKKTMILSSLNAYEDENGNIKLNTEETLEKEEIDEESLVYDKDEHFIRYEQHKDGGEFKLVQGEDGKYYAVDYDGVVKGEDGKYYFKYPAYYIGKDGSVKVKHDENVYDESGRLTIHAETSNDNVMPKKH